MQLFYKWKDNHQIGNFDCLKNKFCECSKTYKLTFVDFLKLFFSLVGHHNTTRTGSKLGHFGLEQRKCLLFTRAKLGGPIISPDFWSRETQEATWQLQFFSTGCCQNFRLADHDENGSCHLHCMLNCFPMGVNIQDLVLDVHLNLHLCYSIKEFTSNTYS